MRCTAEELIRKKTVIKISLNIVLEKKKMRKRIIETCINICRNFNINLINLKREDSKNEKEHD